MTGQTELTRLRALLASFCLVALVAGCTRCGGEREAPTVGDSAREASLEPSRAAYEAEIETWRAERRRRLEAEHGWLSVVGLHWLEPGERSFGSGELDDIRLPETDAAAAAGSLLFDGERVELRPGSAADLTVGGEPVTAARELRTDEHGQPDIVQLGSLRFHIIRRAGRFGVRVKNPHSAARANFRGLDYFPIDPAYRIDARFIAYAPLREIEIPTVLGTSEKMLVPGYAEFELGGRSLRLEPVVSRPDDEKLFFIFKDQTAGEQTYAAGRFLYADRERDARVILDFNRAYNPPCAFTAFATCPLPPRQNILPVSIEAGEKKYAGEHY
ncbi:MAG: DUF1684 domain-containing protein [Acidobacteriota bacterium]|nr:MAG: DUF1684 domain-containing protein [Acidobacteriota bacterium]